MRFDSKSYPFLETQNGLTNICYISKSVRDLIVLSSSKLAPIMKEITPMKRTVLLDPPKAATYIIENNGSEVNLKILTHSSKHVITGIVSVSDRNFSLQAVPNDLTPKSYQLMFESCLFIELFLQFAHVETKDLGTNGKIWSGINCIYNNKTKNNIKVIDSTWFTTLVKSDAFKVRGHFRLQPYGDGTRKLIWINEFQKDGYTREAKILSEHNNG